MLVQPQHPGNVGAAARAMANMGLRRLVVVDPAASFDTERARWMAPGADAVFEALRIVPDLDSALVDAHRVVATTARHRRHGQPVHEPRVVADQFVADAPDRTVAVLFGREDTGLTAADTMRAESLLRIPTAEHASLNLAQAVLLVAHPFFEAARQAGLVATGRVVGGTRGRKSTRELDRSRGPMATAPEVEPAVVELVALLNRVGFTRTSTPERVGVTLREALQRAQLTRKQVHAIRGMLSRVEYALDHPEVDWQASRRQRLAREAIATPPDDD